MQRREPLHITLSAREAVARGATFRAWGVEFAEPDVVRDEISALRAGPEPLVLRVTASGGSEQERDSLVGDWFCDSGGVEPRRLPDPPRDYDEWPQDWARDTTWLWAWENCDDARYLLSAASGVGVDRRLIVLAAAHCARTALRCVPQGERRPRRAIEVAEAWACGVATRASVSAALSAADVVARDEARVAGDLAYVYAANAAADVAAYAEAYAVYDGGASPIDGPPDYAINYAAYAADAAAHATVYYELGDRSEVAALGPLREMAALVRRRIETVAVLRAAVGARPRSAP